MSVYYNGVGIDNAFYVQGEAKYVMLNGEQVYPSEGQGLTDGANSLVDGINSLTDSEGSII